MVARGSPAPAELARLERRVLDAIERRTIGLPPYPAVALKVNEAASNPSLGLAEVSRIINADAALAADVLRCANSAFFRRGAAVTSLTQAVTRIGGQEVMRIALAASLGAHARAAGPLATVRRRVWIENLAGAAICEELARLRGRRRDEAFMLGLLHDFGKVVACAALESALAEAQLRGAFTLQAWTEIVERLHVRVGSAMARAWRLPDLLVDVISHHHEVAAAPAHEGLLPVVKASDDVVALLTTSPSVTSDDLAKVASIAPAERERVAHAVELVPELVAAFEPPAQGAASPAEPSAVARPEAVAAPAGEPPMFRISIQVARRAREYAVSAISGDLLLATGDEPLPENRLVEVQLNGAPEPFRMWALVQGSRPEGQAFAVELRPFALNAVERKAWERLTAAARR
jgi:HD-like signal output (HDOD) protein